MNTYTVRYNIDTRTIELVDGGQTFTLDPNSKTDMRWYRRVVELPNTVFENVDAAGNVTPSDKDHAPLITNTVRFNTDTKEITIDNGIDVKTIDKDDEDDIDLYRDVMAEATTTYEVEDASGVVTAGDKDHAPLITHTVRFNTDTKEITVDNGIDVKTIDKDNEDDIESYSDIMAEDSTTYEVVDATGVVTAGDKAAAPIITAVVRYNEDTDTIEIDDGIQTVQVDQTDKAQMKAYKKLLKKDSTTFEKIDATGAVVSRNKADAPYASRRALRSGRSRVRAARTAARTRHSGGHSKALKVGAIVAGSAAGLGILATGACHLVKHHKAKVATNTNTNKTSVFDLDITNDNFLDIINERFANNETAREFHTTLRNTLFNLNLATSGPNFVMEKDKETLSVLRFNHNEVMAAMIALNNYSPEELLEIFGDYSLSKEEVFENYKSFINKMSIYYMNGKEPIGLSSIIRDEGNRTLFETFEKAITTFNSDLSNKNADKIMRYFEYYIIQSSNNYVYTLDLDEINKMSTEEFNAFVKKVAADGENSTDRLELDSVTAPFVKHLIVNMVQGYRNANSQADYKTYRTVSSAAGNFDRLFTKDSLAQVQVGQGLDEYFTRKDEESLTIIETTGCETAKVEKHIYDSVDSLSELQSKTRTEIAALLVDAGLSDLADKVLDGISAEEYKELRANDKASEILDSKLKGSDLAFLLLTDTFDKIDKEVFELRHGYLDESGDRTLVDDIATVFNNRVRGLDKIKDAITNENGGTQYTPGTTTTTTSTDVISYTDLTEEERIAVDAEKEKIDEESYQVTIDGKTFDQGKASEAAKAGWEDGTSYANNGSYSYHDVINNVNPDAPSVVPTNGSLFNTAANAYAFEGVVITTSDSQIQSKLSSDLAKYISSYSSEYSDSYKEGWLSGVSQVLNSAVSAGTLLRSEAEEEYRRALEIANSQNGSDSGKENDTSTEIIDEEDEFDGLDLYDPDDEILHPNPVDSVDGFDDIYDPGYDGKDNSYTAFVEQPTLEDNYTAFIEEPTFEDEYTAYTEEQTLEDVKVLVKTPKN